MNPWANRYPRAAFALAVALALVACTNPATPVALQPEGAIVAPLKPAVVAATATSDGVRLTFSQRMDRDSTATAVRVLRLHDHAGREPDLSGDVVAHTLHWHDERTVDVVFAGDSGSFVVEVGAAALSRGARPLDGRSGGGSGVGLHRPDDDGLDGAAAYITQVLHRGDGVPYLVGLPPRPTLIVTDVTAWHGASFQNERDRDPESLWRAGTARVGSFPPRNEDVSFRVVVTSPAGFPWALPNPGDMPRSIAWLTEQGDSIGIDVDLGQSPAVPFVDTTLRVTGVYGRIVTVATGPFTVLGDLRKPEDPLWLIVGGAPPRGIVARVRDWDSATLTYTVGAQATAVTATFAGATALTDRRWPAGALDGGYELRVSDGRTVAITTAVDRQLTLAQSLPGAACPCTVELVRLEERLRPDDEVFLTSTVWYAHPRANPVPDRVYFLAVNRDGLMRSIMGLEFFDEERDGDEDGEPQIAENVWYLKHAFRVPGPRPPATRINDGTLYATVAQSHDYDCLGDPGAPVCARAVADESCADWAPPAEAIVSFYTADGSADQPLGESDLLDLENVGDQSVIVLPSGGARPLRGVMRPEVVLNPTLAGIFPTTIYHFYLIETATGACSTGGDRLRGFHDGDRLVVAHGLYAITDGDSHTLDGDGDGVASPSPEDDWIGVWDDGAATFVPLLRTPRPD